GSIVADALLAGGKSAVKQLNEAYADIEKYSKRSGQYVTEGFEEGGLKAAKALVKELKAQQKEIDAALKKAAKSAAEEFAKVLENASKGKSGTGKSSSSASSSAPPVKGSAAAGSVF